ncbi:hypothetical protein ACOSQ3_009246 [Xanthoceras sorbifolium]
MENLENEVNNLDGTRNIVQHSVEDARRNGEQIEKHVQSWLHTVDNIIDEASKVIEDDDHQQANLQCLNLKNRYQLSKKATAKLKDVVRLKQTAAEFKQVSYRTIPEQTCLQPSKWHQDFELRNSILKDIIDALSTSDINMVGIYGMGGIGKTTVAKQVTTQAKRDRLFDKTIFVEVSQPLDIKNIQGVIADNLGLQFTEETIPGRANRLYDRLKKEEKFLLILDNIWGNIDFEKVGIPFENDRKGLKLLLITRNRDVLTNILESQCNFHMEALNEADAWSLFKSITGTRVEQPDLESIALQVAKECGGMPIAIVTVARALKNKGQDEWKKALRELKNPSSESFEGITKEVYTSIQLSYNYLETKELKEIFLLCSRMGRTYDASVRDLFRYGWGLGLFDKFNTMEEALCSVYALVNTLKATSLLLNAPKNEYTDNNPPDSERFAMHDVICGIARSIASRDQHVFTVIDDVIPQSWANENTLRNCTSITLHNIGELPEDLLLVCPKLKFLYVKPKKSFFRIPDNFFTRMSGLQVLHLVEMNLQALPTSFNCLVNNLNVLCLDQCKLGDTTVIGDLKKLEILSIRDSDIKKLSEQMRQLTKLRLLDLSNCSKLSVIPPNVMSSLTKLEAFYMGNTSINWEVERPNIERSNVSFNELKHLLHLIILEIHIPDVKMSKGLLPRKLERYKIFIGDEWEKWNWNFHSKTSRMLKLSLHTNEAEIISQLKGIEELELGELLGARNLLDDLNGNGFPTLKHLNVHSNSHCLELVSCGALPLLESLIVEKMHGLEKICNRPLEAESFGQLRTINVSTCHKLNNILSFSTVTALPQLQEIEVYDCENIKDIFDIGEQGDGNNNEVVHEIKFRQLRILSLQVLPRLNSFCCKVKTASPEEELDIPTSLFDDKVVSPNLEVLKVYEIHVEKIWHNLLPTMSSCVQNLTQLTVQYCSNLEELFSSSIVVSEESREEERRDTISFPKLHYLEMRDLAKLTRLWSGYYIEFPSLKNFKIRSCPALETFIFDDKVRVPSLEEMEIHNMDNLKMIWHNQLDGDSFRKIKSLQVEKCQKLLNVFTSNMCERLLSMESLNIFDCGSLEEIFELQGIISEEGNSIAATTQSRELSFSNLQNLRVSRCPSLKNLFAASIVANEGVLAQQVPARFCFPKLTSLVLIALPELRNLYHGRHKVKGPVLKTLDLSRCGTSQMQQIPAFPCLEELTLIRKQAMVMWQGHVSECLFQKLKILEVVYDESAVLPLGIIQKFQNLDKLSLSNGSYKEIFSYGDLFIWFMQTLAAQAVTPIKLKTLFLKRLRNLKCMWKQDSKLDLILQNLEELTVFWCHGLIILMPPSASFQNLTILEVNYCNSLEIMVTSSTAKSLVKLTKMDISYCKNITEVVGNQGDVTGDKIIFNSLKSLSLRQLPRLTSFCSWNCTLEFPSLEELNVSSCPNMKIFSGGDLITQRLPKVEINWTSVKLCPDNNLNTAIQQFHKKKVHIDSLS